MEIDDANELVIREALRRLGPRTQFDPAAFKSRSPRWSRNKGRGFFAQLSDAAREQLRNEGLRLNEQAIHLGRVNEAIEYGRSLVEKYKVATLGELPEEEQREFARLWSNATGGVTPHEN